MARLPRQVAGFNIARGDAHDRANHAASGDDYRVETLPGGGTLAALADGVSSAYAPAQASTFVAEALAQRLGEAWAKGGTNMPAEVLHATLSEAARSVHDDLRVGRGTPTDGLAAVASAVLWPAERDGVTLVHAGDTRVYGVYVGAERTDAPDEPLVVQLTTDHTAVVMRERRRGERDTSGGVVQHAAGITQAYGLDDARYSPARPPDLKAITFEPPGGAELLAVALASDGWTGVVSDDRIRAGLVEAVAAVDVSQAVAALVHDRAGRPDADDCSLVVIREPLTRRQRVAWGAGDPAPALATARGACAVLAEALASGQLELVREALAVLRDQSVSELGCRAWRSGLYDDVKASAGSQLAWRDAGFLLGGR